MLKMLRNFKMLATFSLVLMGAHCRADLIADLLPNRTYFLVETLSAPAHQFVVWIKTGSGWIDYAVSVNGEQEVENLQKASLRATGVIYAGWPSPSQDLSVPDEPTVNQLGAALKQRMTKLFPKVKEIRIGYTDFYQSLYVTELVPLTPPGSEPRIGRRSENELRITSSGVESAPTGMFGGYGLLRRGDKWSANVSLLDFTLPPQIEGSTILILGLGTTGAEATPLHLRAYEEFQKALINFTRQKHKPSIDAVFAKISQSQSQSQGTKILAAASPPEDSDAPNLACKNLLDPTDKPK